MKSINEQYRVTDQQLDAATRFACECAANKHGIGCWHVRSALANETIYQQAKRDEAAAAIRIAEEQAEYERLMMVPQTVYRESEVKAACKRNQSKPFTLLR